LSLIDSNDIRAGLQANIEQVLAD